MSWTAREAFAKWGGWRYPTARATSATVSAGLRRKRSARRTRAPVNSAREQLGLGLATGDPDCDPVVHVGYPNANAKFTTTTRPRGSAGPSGSELSHSVAPSSVGMCTRANTDI